MILRGIGDPERGDAYTVSRFASGREVAALRLKKSVNDTPLWADLCFGFAVALVSSLFFIWIHEWFGGLFIETWKRLNG